MKRKKYLKLICGTMVCLNVFANSNTFAQENNAQPTNNEATTNTEESKYSATYIYEDYDNLPQIVKDTLPPKYKSNNRFSFFWQPPRLKDVVDKENKKLWEASLFKRQEPKTGDHRIYKATWTSTDMVEISFNINEPQDLPEDLKGKTFENTLSVSGRKVDVPATEEVKKGDTVWVLSFPETIAGDTNSTVTGEWTSRPVSYNGTVTFVTNNGNQNVNFENPNERIDKTDTNGNKANQDDSGGGFTKAYFLGWSTIKGYNGNQKNAKMFYGHEDISSAFPNGFVGGEKLYAVYLSASSALSVNNQMAGDVEINKFITDLEIMDNKFIPKETEDKNHTFYVKNVEDDLSVVNLGSSLKLNPFSVSIIRKNNYFAPGTAEFYGANDETVLANKEANLKERIEDIADKYTYVDLHVKLDERLTIADTLKFDFKSYSFRPFVILKPDYSGEFTGVTINNENNSPLSHITFNTEGKKEFILRTRIKYSHVIPNATLEEASTDMQLISTDKGNFKLSKEEILKIARGETEKIVIGGHIQGGAKLWEGNVPILGHVGGPTDIPKKIAKNLTLDFKPAFVTFNKNSSNIEENTEQNLGKVRVATGGTIKDDIFDKTDKPTTDAIGEAMPDDLTEKITKDGLTYIFAGWATTANATVSNFTADTEVSEDMTVYAVWKSKTKPVLEVEDKEIFVGEALILKDLIKKIYDEEDGDKLTKDNVVIKDGGFNNKVAGKYTITFEVTDSNGATTTKTATVTVKEKPTPNKPIITPNPKPENPEIKPDDKTKPTPPSEIKPKKDKKKKLAETGINTTNLTLMGLFGLVLVSILKRKRKN